MVNIINFIIINSINIKNIIIFIIILLSYASSIVFKPDPVIDPVQ
jgi:hypothetical protein